MNGGDDGELLIQREGFTFPGYCSCYRKSTKEKKHKKEAVDKSK